MLEKHPEGDESRVQRSWAAASFNKAVKGCHDAGSQILLHAIGERGVRLTLDAYEQLPRQSRSGVEQIEVISAADIPRLARRVVFKPTVR